LKADRECDFTGPTIGIAQKLARLFEAGACDIIHKIYAGYLLKLFAQMIGVNVDGFRHLAE
jgi:hypothetical protein